MYLFPLAPITLSWAHPLEITQAFRHDAHLPHFSLPYGLSGGGKASLPISILIHFLNMIAMASFGTCTWQKRVQTSSYSVGSNLDRVSCDYPDITHLYIPVALLLLLLILLLLLLLLLLL